jgi:predicted amidophosphoribosyltransferase
MNNIRTCPNCHEDCQDLGTLTLVCWSCGLQFMPKAEKEDDERDYNGYDE